MSGASATWLSLQPLGAERVRCRIAGALLADESGVSLADVVKRAPRDATIEFMAEDQARIEALQRGLQVFEPTQPYCSMERTSWELGHYLHRRLCANI